MSGGHSPASAVPGHVVWRAGRVVPRGHAGVHAVGALQAQRVVRLLPGWRRLVVQDGVLHERRGPQRAVAQRRAVGHDRGVGGRGARGGHEVGLRPVQRLPLALSFSRRSLLELGQTTSLFFDHLLTWRNEEEEEEPGQRRDRTHESGTRPDVTFQFYQNTPEARFTNRLVGVMSFQTSVKK